MNFIRNNVPIILTIVVTLLRSTKEEESTTESIQTLQYLINQRNRELLGIKTFILIRLEIEKWEVSLYRHIVDPRWTEDNRYWKRVYRTRKWELLISGCKVGDTKYHRALRCIRGHMNENGITSLELIAFAFKELYKFVIIKLQEFAYSGTPINLSELDKTDIGICKDAMVKCF